MEYHIVVEELFLTTQMKKRRHHHHHRICWKFFLKKIYFVGIVIINNSVHAQQQQRHKHDLRSTTFGNNDEDVIHSNTTTTTTYSPMPSFDIDLDLPPEERWNDVMIHFNDKFQMIMDFILQQFPKHLIPEIVEAAKLAERYGLWPTYIKDEMTGIAQMTKRNVGLILIINLFYELVSGCTSVVVQNLNDKSIWHGRNLDFDIPQLQDIALSVRFITRRNNNNDTLDVVYEGITYAGYIGLPTGLKKGIVSISQDQRRTNKPIWTNLAQWILEGGQAYSFLIRDILASTDSYDDALRRLQFTPLIAPCYFIIAGTNRGAVITRNRNGPADTWDIDSSKGRWFLVQTNDDHWLPPKDKRRNATNQHIQSLCNNPYNVTNECLFQVMNMYPTLNKLTTYTSILNPSKNYVYSVIQNVGANAVADAADGEGRAQEQLNIHLLPILLLITTLF